MNKPNICTSSLWGGQWGHLFGHIEIDPAGPNTFPDQSSKNIINRFDRVTLNTESGWSIVFDKFRALFSICNNGEVVVADCNIISVIEIDADHFIYFDGNNVRVIVVEWTDDESRSDYSGFVSGCKTPEYKKHYLPRCISDIAAVIADRFVVILAEIMQPDVFDMKTGFYCLFESEDDRIKGDISYTKYTPISDREFSIKLQSGAIYNFKINETIKSVTLTTSSIPQIKFAGKKA